MVSNDFGRLILPLFAEFVVHFSHFRALWLGNVLDIFFKTGAGILFVFEVLVDVLDVLLKTFTGIFFFLKILIDVIDILFEICADIIFFSEILNCLF